jgi:RHS repeat-associated protein
MDDFEIEIETYTYGATRERLINETSTQRTYYAWGGSSVICEYIEPIASSTPVYAKSYQYAGSRLVSTSTKASSTTETTEFHHPDRLGTKLVTNHGAGTSYQQSTLPFGTALSAESSGYSNQVFTSYDRSAGTGLDYAVNRTYSQGQSRFTQVDPIGMAAASLGNPQSNNLYAYVQNMPTDFVDPSGLDGDIPDVSGPPIIMPTTWTTRIRGTMGSDTTPMTMEDPPPGEELPGDDGGVIGSGEDPKEVAKNDRCKFIIAKAAEAVSNFLKEWNKYNPEQDAVGGIQTKRGPTKPFGHWKEMKDYQNAMKNRIAQYDRECNDRNDGRGGRGGALPHGIRSLSGQYIPRKAGPSYNFFKGPTSEQVRQAMNSSAKSAAAGATYAVIVAGIIIWILVN